MRLLLAVTAGLLLTACGSPAQHGQPDRSGRPLPASSSASAPAPPTATSPAARAGFVSVSDVDDSILLDIRYATEHNFVGRPVTGYLAPRCLLTRQAAGALHRVQEQAVSRGYSLKVYDCYRPQRAVDDFVAWSRDADQRMKAEFYPREDKAALFPDGYIGGPTAHSRGSTLDLTLVALPAKTQPMYRTGDPLAACTAPAERRFADDMIDMGTGFDCFDPLAHTAATVSPAQRANRDLLTGLMASGGFTNYPKEWWHYTLTSEPYPTTYYDFPVA